jgi:hypothetical protein
LMSSLERSAQSRRLGAWALGTAGTGQIEQEITVPLRIPLHLPAA